MLPPEDTDVAGFARDGRLDCTLPGRSEEPGEAGVRDPQMAIS
jgi:hypothetical protein